MKLTINEKVRKQILSKSLEDRYSQRDIAKEINCNYKSVGQAFAEMVKRGEIKIVKAYKHEFGFIERTSSHVYQRLTDFKVRITEPVKPKPKNKKKVIDTSQLLTDFAFGGNVNNIRNN